VVLHGDRLRPYPTAVGIAVGRRGRTETYVEIRIRPYHIADGGVATVVNVHMLDADKLLSARTQASENFHLHGIRLH
jgi:hypothetical protein